MFSIEMSTVLSHSLYFECRWTLKLYMESVFFFVSLVIRGDKEERAVLCSGDKTYDLKIADTSNLLLFVPECKTPDQLTDSQNGPHVVHTQVGECQPTKHLQHYLPMYLCVQHLSCINFVVFVCRSGDFLTATGNWGKHDLNWRNWSSF